MPAAHDALPLALFPALRAFERPLLEQRREFLVSEPNVGRRGPGEEAEAGAQAARQFDRCVVDPVDARTLRPEGLALEVHASGDARVGRQHHVVVGGLDDRITQVAGALAATTANQDHTPDVVRGQTVDLLVVAQDQQVRSLPAGMDGEWAHGMAP
jgi:hypothetical protein